MHLCAFACTPGCCGASAAASTLAAAAAVPSSAVAPSTAGGTSAGWPCTAAAAAAAAAAACAATAAPLRGGCAGRLGGCGRGSCDSAACKMLALHSTTQVSKAHQHLRSHCAKPSGALKHQTSNSSAGVCLLMETMPLPTQPSDQPRNSQNVVVVAVLSAPDGGRRLSGGGVQSGADRGVGAPGSVQQGAAGGVGGPPHGGRRRQGCEAAKGLQQPAGSAERLLSSYCRMCTRGHNTTLCFLFEEALQLAQMHDGSRMRCVVARRWCCTP